MMMEADDRVGVHCAILYQTGIVLSIIEFSRMCQAQLVAEVPDACDDHGDAVGVTGGDRVGVVHGTAGLDDRGYTRGSGGFDRVGKGEKGI
jgi:hypothetical protein